MRCSFPFSFTIMRSDGDFSSFKMGNENRERVEYTAAKLTHQVSMS